MNAVLRHRRQFRQVLSLMIVFVKNVRTCFWALRMLTCQDLGQLMLTTIYLRQTDTNWVCPFLRSYKELFYIKTYGGPH